ncbi:hypothetical protein KAU11_08915 [Candidatus Babeliales bacterium]|nr:hypothetical protein [Candidatus Babeliales bacterium]
MRQIITKKDIKNIIGKWVVQIDGKRCDMDLTRSENDGFWLEKRISFVNCIYGVDAVPHYEPRQKMIIMSGVFYCKGFYTEDEFVTWFNDASIYNKNGNSRFHRLLTNNELDWLNERLKVRNS